MLNNARTHIKGTAEAAGAWGKNKTHQAGKNFDSVKNADYAGLGGAIGGQWNRANAASSDYLNSTAMGMAGGAVLGGGVGGVSDNGSVMGGMAGGALLGVGGGAAYRAGANYLKTSRYTQPQQAAGLGFTMKDVN